MRIISHVLSNNIYRYIYNRRVVHCMTMAHHGSWLMGWLCQCFSECAKMLKQFSFCSLRLLCPFAIAYPPANACHYSQHTAQHSTRCWWCRGLSEREREKTNSSHFSRLFCSSSRCLRALAWHGSAMRYGSMHTSTGKCLTFSLAGIKRFQHAVPLFSYFCFDRLECSTPLSTKHKQNRRNTSSATTTTSTKTTTTENHWMEEWCRAKRQRRQSRFLCVTFGRSSHFGLVRRDATRVRNVFKQ